ncbi:MAG: hypothetical protein QOD99_433 [Chthoniobacter sp.]|jgi:hypothetical protein|nr:hypothetical protein [Chthoniobacter sp.]
MRGWLIVIASLLAAVSAQPYAGSWNDGSRLAAAESLVDRGTWVIDDSIFVKPHRATISPYADPDSHGTLDRVRINGRYFSDKTPVPNLGLAAIYASLRALLGLRAAESPSRFCYLLTLFSSGAAYVIAVACCHRLTIHAALPKLRRLVVVASFAVGTVALAYTQSVNQHIWMLAVCSLLFVLLDDPGFPAIARWVGIGTCAGMGYCIDFGIGAVLVAITLVWAAYHARAVRPIVFVVVGMLPWLALHHWLNGRTGGTWLPLNMDPANFVWPGSPFTPENLTGSLPHRSPGKSVLYALDLLVGKRGFLMHNLPLWLAVIGFVPLLRKRTSDASVLMFAASLSVGSWLLYSLMSVGSSGVCLSVRWFVPLLAPGYYVLIALLREVPEAWPDFVVLALGGFILGVPMWQGGPWRTHMVPGYWIIVAGTLLGWLAWRLCLSGSRRSKT